VHLLVSVPPNLAPSEIMRRIKGRSANKLFEVFSELKKRYWGEDIFGQEGIFVLQQGRQHER